MSSQTPSSTPDLMSSATPTTIQAPSFTVSNSLASTSSRDPSSSVSYSARWDVFLSFRGSDTRNKFTGHLYDKLDSNGIQTFKDDPELRSGEVISDALLDAIRKSKTYIVVLSENYASSRWCLDELAEILDCYRTMQRSVIPVFYNIDPAVVRHQTESFKKAFQKHQVRFQLEKVSNWRHALTEVASFSGYHVSENRCEAHVINEIVDELLLQINPNTLNVTKYPVQLDSRVKDITSLLSGDDTKGVIKFGIYGMGGVGKTTLAKALFNQLIRGGRFKGSCFLANVRENSKTEQAKVSLQMQLIDNVLRSTTKVDVPNVDQGIKLIEARICSTKIVVVIDDLDDLNQFQSLVGPFASGSVVIITTRDEEMLIKTEVETRYRYMVNTLDDADSLALFMRHAFRNAEPNDTLMELSKDILCLAAGLPLALEVFGSYLYERSEVGWKYYIEKLHRNPNSSIHQRLKISLDALESDDLHLKKIFLDIACCFNGWKKQDVVQITESYYSYADYYIDMLKKRCLLTIDSNDRLGMHDLLQDMGREIAHNNSHDEPGKHSRLWVTEDIHDVLKNQKGTKAIECIILGKKESPLEEIAYTTETFERMSKLRFLYLNKVNLTGSFEHSFDDLRWLCWDQCPLECLPSNFYPQNLVILELPHSHMRTMWELNMVSRVFGKLKTLNMSDSKHLSTTPDFTKFPCLETLNLCGCKSLETVHMSIGSLGKLVSLNLEGCQNLRSLPDTICSLRALKILSISKCNSLEAMPTQLGNIISLTKLDAGGLKCSPLPDSIGYLTKLVKLNLMDNEKLESLPDSMCNLKSLEILDISCCSGLEALPTAIGNIESLRKFSASELTISRLPDSIGSLTKLVKLYLHGNKKLENLPDTICNLESLNILEIRECETLETLPDQLWKITSLRKLAASDATQLKRLPDIGSSQIALSLQELYLSRSGITSLPSGLSQLSNLQELHVSRCIHLLFIPELPPNLKQIYADGCESLESLPNLSNLKHLKESNLAFCSGLTEIPGLEELTALRKIRLTDCKGLTYIQGLEQLISIKYLELKGLVCVTKRLFQAYCEFGQQISIHAPENLHYWLTESRYWTWGSSQSDSLTVYAHLLPNESRNFMGIILCFEKRIRFSLFRKPLCYSVKNTTSGFVWTGDLFVPSRSVPPMVIVPKSIFSVSDDDHIIEFTANSVKKLGIHLLYNTETEMTEDFAEKHVIALKLVDPVLQDIFLDIACFFIKWEKEYVVQILETYYSNVDQNIDILKKGGLLTTNTEDQLEMNDLLQSVGRKIASNNSPDDPGRHSRLWLSSDIHDVLKKHKGTEMITSIIPHNVYSRKDALEGESFTSEAFKKMSKLRFLYLKNINFFGSFQQIFEDLRWLRWDSCPLKCLPSAFHPSKLVILELPNSCMRTMWEPNMVSHLFENLKTLDMSFSQDLTTTPDFNKLPCLENLSLEGCISLEEVHVSIGGLVRLVRLDLNGCVKLKSLPRIICNLRALKVLDIHDCCSLEALPTAFGSAKSPEELVVEELAVSNLPDPIGHSSKLVELRSKKNLETLTEIICNLRSLEILDISNCEKLEILLNQVFTLTSLTELNAGGATLLKIHPNIGLRQMALSLQTLDFSDSLLTALPSAISQLPNIQYLDLKDCCLLLSITELPPNLIGLSTRGCRSLQRFPNLKDFNRLKVLDLTNCSGLYDIQGLKGLTSIRKLRLKGCNSSFLANIFTRCFFQICCEFGHPIHISSPLAEFPYWIKQSSEYSSTMCLESVPKTSCYFLGMILCFKSLGSSANYTIKNTTRNFILNRYICSCSPSPLMVIVPDSIFSVSNGGDRIELTTEDAEIYGIHLLYKSYQQKIWNSFLYQN